MVHDTQLTVHFRLSEFTTSGVAARRGIDNVPGDDALGNLYRLADVLERVRRLLVAAPLLITSGFRSPEVNALVGGARRSAHIEGRAADFVAPSFGTPKDICQRIAATDIPFDQLILEGGWVHLTIPIKGEDARRQLLTAVFQRGYPARYVRGIV